MYCRENNTFNRENSGNFREFFVIMSYKMHAHMNRWKKLTVC